MPRKIRDCRFSIIPLIMTAITENLSFTRAIPEVLWMYHSSSVCWIKPWHTDNAGFILDRGYFSRENIKYMDKCGYDFVIMVKGMKALVNDAVKEVRYIR